MEIENWKEYWLQRQEDQSRKKETRKEKKKVRRWHHKNRRKRVREQIKHYINDLEELEDDDLFRE